MPVRAISGPVTRSGQRMGLVNKLRGFTAPAPIGGWNARDSLAAMPESDAIVLDNWWPNESWLSVRNGYESHATGMSTVVESLMSYNAPSATDSASKLFAAAGGKIYNASAAGAVGAADLSGLTNNRWQHTMFGTSAGEFLYIVNGADDPRYYTGSAWVTPSLTGTTAANMIHINAFKRRLFFIENNSLSFWYLDIVSVAGALTEFKLGGLASLGGYLMAMGTWTRDGGDGVDDFAVFITSKGQAIVFQGDDPSDVDHWYLVGVFNIPPPIGRRCMVRMASDLVIITIDGFSEMSKLLPTGRTSDLAILSDKITHAVNDAVIANSSRWGWQPVFYPAGGMVLVNIPTSTAAVQFVSNTTTGAWARFTGMNANCWEVHLDQLYFGGTGTVYLADTGDDDDGANIVTAAKPAFSYFGDRGRRKRVAMVRPMFEIDGAISAAIRANVDFEDVLPTDTPTFTPAAGEAWDVAAWDTAVWGDSPTISKDWQSITGVGHAITFRLATTSKNGSIKWFSSDYLWEPTASPGYL